MSDEARALSNHKFVGRLYLQLIIGLHQQQGQYRLCVSVHSDALRTERGSLVELNECVPAEPVIRLSINPARLSSALVLSYITVKISGSKLPWLSRWDKTGRAEDTW